MDLKLKGKTALVTGGSAGIGYAIAHRLASEGVDVAICARRPDQLESAGEKLRAETGRTIHCIQTDITALDDIADLASSVEEKFGRLDILINNAGTGTYKPFLEVTDEELVQGMQMNFFSMFRVTQKMVPLMIRSGGGVIVNIAGTSGTSSLDDPFFSTCTGPAKAAEIRFTKALAVELGPQNIRVNVVAPGRINAPERFARWQRDIARDNPDEVQSIESIQREWGKRICLPNHVWGEVDEVADLAVFATSPVCRFMTGSVLVIDGGETRD